MKATLRKLAQQFGRCNVPSVNSIRNLLRKFEESGVATDAPKPGRARKVRVPAKTFPVFVYFVEFGLL